MKTLCKIIALLGLVGVAYAGPSGPPAGSYILNVSTSVSTPAFKVSSGTVNTQLKLGYGSKGSLIWLDTNGIVTTTTTIPAGGDVVKASTQTLTGFNTFTGSTTHKSQVVIQTINSGSSQGSGGALFINATNESGMPVQVYSSSANSQAFLNLINSSTGYANSYIYVNGASSTTGKANAYFTDPNPNIQFVETGVVAPAGKYEFMVLADTFQLRSMNSGGSAYKPRIGMTHPGALCFYETNDNGHFVCFSASNTIASNVNWTLPAADSSGCFQSDGAGNLSIAPCGGSGIVSPGTFTWTNNGFGINIGTATMGSTSSTALGNNPWVSINSSGTSQALTITNYGYPSGGVQNELGVVNIKRPLGDSPGASLVLVDSVTDAQVGAGVLELWSDNPLHNDPLFWIHRTSSNSSPEMRWDSPSPNMEMVNTSTDNAHGLGKWEPFAEASQGVDLQVNNRAWSNGTFETLAYWHPLSKKDVMPGLYINPQNITDDGGILASSDTTGVSIFTLDGHTVGITAPQQSRFSYTLGLPILPKAMGLLLYNNGNRGGNFSVRQTTWTDTDFTYLPTTGVKISTLTLTGQMTGAGLTDCSSASSAVSWASATGKFGCNTISGGGGSGGSSSLAVTTGIASGFTGPAISSPTAVLSLDQNYFSILSAGATAFTTITPLFADTNTWTGAQTIVSSLTISGQPTSAAMIVGGSSADNTDRHLLTLQNNNTSSGGNSQTSIYVQEGASAPVGELKWTDYSGTVDKGIPFQVYTSVNGSGINSTPALFLSGAYGSSSGTKGGINTSLPASVWDVEGLDLGLVNRSPIIRANNPNGTNNVGNLFEGQKGGSNVFVVDNLGDINASSGVFSGSNGFNTTYGIVAGSITINTIAMISSNTILGAATYYANGVIAGASLNANELTGTLQAGQFPALTGDVTTTAGSLATTATGTQANITTLSHAITATSSVTVTGANLTTNFLVVNSSVSISSNTILGAATYYTNGVIAGASMSATELTGVLQAAQEPAHTGDVTNTAGSLAMTASGTQANITNFSHSLTITSSVTVNSTLQVSTLTTVGGIYNQGYNTASSNYVITSTDSYILCNCANNAVTLTLPLSSTANGQFLSITKADQSASSCTIRGAGSDQIVSTGTWFLYAQAQQLVIQSTGGVNLWQRAGAMDAPVETLGNNIIANAAETVAASSSVYCTWQTVTSPQRASGMYSSQSTANGNIDLGIIDTQGNKLAETGVIAMAGTSTITNFTSAVNLLPGVYGFCTQISNVTGAIRGAGISVNKSFFNTETTMGIPATLTVPGTTTSLTFGIAAAVTGAQ